MSRCDNLSVMNRSKSASLIALAVVIAGRCLWQHQDWN